VGHPIVLLDEAEREASRVGDDAQKVLELGVVEDECHRDAVAESRSSRVARVA
jgi:hypothetical protein